MIGRALAAGANEGEKNPAFYHRHGTAPPAAGSSRVGNVRASAAAAYVVGDRRRARR
jgi:hypothetical protein